MLGISSAGASIAQTAASPPTRRDGGRRAPRGAGGSGGGPAYRRVTQASGSFARASMRSLSGCIKPLPPPSKVPLPRGRPYCCGLVAHWRELYGLLWRCMNRCIKASGCTCWLPHVVLTFSVSRCISLPSFSLQRPCSFASFVSSTCPIFAPRAPLARSYPSPNCSVQR